MNTPKWHVLQNKAGKWYWHKKSRNGKITATSGESFASKRAAVKAVARDAHSWFNPPWKKHNHKEVLKELVICNSIIIHPAQKRLSVWDLEINMDARVEYMHKGEFEILYGKIAVRGGEFILSKGCGRFWLTDRGTFLPSIVSVTEVVK